MSLQVTNIPMLWRQVCAKKMCSHRKSQLYNLVPLTIITSPRAGPSEKQEWCALRQTAPQALVPTLPPSAPSYLHVETPHIDHTI